LPGNCFTSGGVLQGFCHLVADLASRQFKISFLAKKMDFPSSSAVKTINDWKKPLNAQTFVAYSISILNRLK
jgi:hypothetical protein